MGMKDAQQNKRMLVLGATGKTGRRVVERLAARGLPTGWEDAAMWASALQNVGSVYVPYYSDLAVPAAADTVRSDAPEPFVVDAEDIADVAAAALTPLRAGVFRGVRVRSSTGGGAARVHRAPDLPAHRGPRRPQRSPDGRRLACLGPGAQGLQLLRRARHCRHRRLERCSLVTSGPLR
jgi:hypothetical protein